MNAKEVVKAVNELPLDHRKVYSLLERGIDNSVTVSYISKLTGFSSVKVRTLVNELIVKHGKVIGASNHYKHPGYYIPVTDKEKEQAVNNLNSRIKEMMRRVYMLQINMNKN